MGSLGDSLSLEKEERPLAGSFLGCPRFTAALFDLYFYSNKLVITRCSCISCGCNELKELC